MRLYHNTTKRIFKKKVGFFYKKLCLLAKLKVGDAISGHNVYNERITEIFYDWSNDGLSKGKYIYDIVFFTEGEGICYLDDCIWPLRSKGEIEKYYLSLDLEQYKKWSNSRAWQRHKYIYDILTEGNEAFDKDGCLLDSVKILLGEQSEQC